MNRYETIEKFKTERGKTYITNPIYPAIPESEDDAEMISKFEHSFEMATYKAVNGSFSKMFSFATIVGITKLTAFEVRNLAAIAYAVEQKIPTDVTMSKLIVQEE